MRVNKNHRMKPLVKAKVRFSDAWFDAYTEPTANFGQFFTKTSAMKLMAHNNRTSQYKLRYDPKMDAFIEGPYDYTGGQRAVYKGKDIMTENGIRKLYMIDWFWEDVTTVQPKKKPAAKKVAIRRS